MLAKCTIKLPQGKYSYKRLPIGIAESWECKTSNLISVLEYVRVFLDDLCLLTKNSLDDNLDNIEVVLAKLSKLALGPMQR